MREALLLILIAATVAGASSNKKAAKMPCPVCENLIAQVVDVYGDLRDEDSAGSTDKDALAARAIDVYCRNNMINTSERRMCSFLEPLRQVAAKAVAMKMTIPRICKKLHKENPQTCGLVAITDDIVSGRSQQEKETASKVRFGEDPEIVMVRAKRVGNMTAREKRELDDFEKMGVLFF
mmetsp:Transcript_38752/g.89295  ORF Transcript_38752/g.89295 Transcript_38752/m.89295 type:complete len:179 (+) Transcript_38752:266-802(+)|eukprot:CAMPEP_0182563590 /NCGR_PEP_ID=MMETSP1324-20130603/5699_1 /TAXON_ID=236786 /ORGANISM="Florenciella sp., Strain RCC1587" /LENGTH=178 /DNA_ID=CAMNT_0024776823 /DNA_START=165 /DNA_END=701 /DNA_ORIENTATION=+